MLMIYVERLETDIFRPYSSQPELNNTVCCPPPQLNYDGNIQSATHG